MISLGNFAQHLNFYIFSITTSTFDLPYILLMKMAFEIRKSISKFANLTISQLFILSLLFWVGNRTRFRCVYLVIWIIRIYRIIVTFNANTAGDGKSFLIIHVH